jgi:type II secretory pathway component PulF
MTESNPSPDPTSLQAYTYRGNDAGGQSVGGTIQANDLEEAVDRLRSVGLRIVAIEATQESTARTAPAQAPLRAGDFLAFNQQLAQLATAGLPVEQGLKLIAQDLCGGRLAAVVTSVANELERGTSLGDALAQHRKQFPPLYSQLVEAGVRSNSLGGLLLNLSVHLQMVRRLRATLWRIVAYPLMVLVGLVIVLLFLSRAVFPQFQQMFATFRPQTQFDVRTLWGHYHEPPDSPLPTLPLITQVLFAVGAVLPYAVIAIIAVVALLPALWRWIQHSGSGQFDRLTYRLPLIGPILRMSLLARWCDIARLGISAGLDLPATIRLAGDAIAAPALMQDGISLIHDLESGRPITLNDRLAILPRVVPASIEMASRTGSLRDVLGSLSDVYRRQAETLLDNLPAILSPALLVVLAISIGFVIAGLLLPVLNYIHYVSGIL